LRDEEMPGEEEREEPPTEAGDDEAREASSSESRGAARPLVFDMLLRRERGEERRWPRVVSSVAKSLH
jgi:hypothetical protein